MPMTVSENCPRCGTMLVVRERRVDAIPFIGCSAFPLCRFTEPFDARLQRLAERVAELEDDKADHDTASLAGGAIPWDRIRRLIFAWHPDRQREPLSAHEVTSALLALRA